MGVFWRRRMHFCIFGGGGGGGGLWRCGFDGSGGKGEGEGGRSGSRLGSCFGVWKGLLRGYGCGDSSMGVSSSVRSITSTVSSCDGWGGSGKALQIDSALHGMQSTDAGKRGGMVNFMRHLRQVEIGMVMRNGECKQCDEGGGEEEDSGRDEIMDAVGRRCLLKLQL